MTAEVNPSATKSYFIETESHLLKISEGLARLRDNFSPFKRIFFRKFGYFSHVSPQETVN